MLTLPPVLLGIHAVLLAVVAITKSDYARNHSEAI